MGDGQATIRLNHNTEDNLAGYRFYRATASDGPYELSVDVPIANVHPDAPAATLTDFSMNGTWHFTASAYNALNYESINNPHGTKDILRTTMTKGTSIV